MPPVKFQISRDSPAYYLTSVTKDRLPVFRKPEFAQVACQAISEARASGGFLIFAYVIMLDHIHLVTDSSRKASEILRFVNGIVSRRIIDHLKASVYTDSLDKLKISKRADGWQYSLWQHHSDSRLLWSENMLWQKIQYTHLNPVRAGLSDHPNDWRWSSARIFHNRRSEDEPLLVDLASIKWRG